MADYPVIFSKPMVLALLDVRKSMTRRLAWRESRKLGVERAPTIWQKVKPGDRLWVKETALYWIRNSDNKRDKIAAYAADGYQLEDGERWTSSLFMSRTASRISLIVTATKVEPLNHITHDDAVAEGASADGGPGTMMGFINIWNKLHGERAFDDSAHVEVVAISFRCVHANIDAAEARAA